MSGEETKTIKAVKRTFEIIETLTQERSAGVSDVAEAVGIPVSTTYVHLNTLRHLGYVVKSDDQYRLSLRFLEHGGAVRQQMDFFTIVKDEVNHITYLTGEIAGFGVEEQGRRVVLYRSEGRESVGDQIPIGEHTYLHWTSLGKAIMAHLPENRVTEIIDNHGLPTGTEQTIRDRDALFAELESIRESGYAVDDAERRRGIRGVAVPVLDANEDILGSVGVAGPSTRFDETYMSSLIDVLRDKKNILEVRHNFYR